MLDGPARAAMFDLYRRYYDACSPALFENDLTAKDFAIVIRNDDEAVVGFSTLAIVEFSADGERRRAIYSGDTVIDHSYWGTQALAFNWIRFAGQIKAQAPDVPLYWFLIVKGHRTYRYLSAFSVDFYPHWEHPTPPGARAIMDQLARRRFGDAYDPARGVVSFGELRGHLKPVWASTAPDEAARPDVSFFLQQNPGYTRGDELVCLTELSPGNLRPIARRVFCQGFSP